MPSDGWHSALGAADGELAMPGLDVCSSFVAG